MVNLDELKVKCNTQWLIFGAARLTNKWLLPFACDFDDLRVEDVGGDGDSTALVDAAAAVSEGDFCIVMPT